MSVGVSDAIDWQGGRVEFWDLDDLDLEAGFHLQHRFHKEDLAQIVYPSDRLIDIGWYPGSVPTGVCRLLVVERGEWDTPIFSEACVTGKKFLDGLKRAIAVARQP